LVVFQRKLADGLQHGPRNESEGGIFVWPVGQNNKREPPIGLRIVPPICQKSNSFVYAQIVFHTERPVNAFGGDLGHVLIAFVCYV
jgi:hypothetical protein